jgi:hypothetical protein
MFQMSQFAWTYLKVYCIESFWKKAQNFTFYENLRFLQLHIIIHVNEKHSELANETIYSEKTSPERTTSN